MTMFNRTTGKESGGDRDASGKSSRTFLSFLILTSMICGALVMVVEVLGSRVIGPFFGVSLFIWTALITVTLVALSLGYAAGGLLSDRKPSPDYLYGIILLAGVLVLLIPIMKGQVLKLSFPLGLRAGSLISATILFGPALLLLGCVSPYIIRIAAREMKVIGRTVGVFYALSTLGSVVGTVITGFVLIAYFTVNQIFTVIGMLLIVLAVFYFIFVRKMPIVSAFLLLPLLLYQGDAPVSKIMGNGTRVTKVASRDSFYGNIKVIDYTGTAIRTREMMIDGLIQGGVDRDNSLSIYEYSYFLQFLPFGINPAGKNCLIIGLGAGIVPTWYRERGVATDIVDIDPAVARMAERYFGFVPADDLIITDARYYLNSTKKKYDYIILDVFNGDTTPGHVLSLEALQLARARLTDSGLLAVNMIGSLKRETFMTASVIKTLQVVFDTVAVYPTFSPNEEPGSGNIVIIAYAGNNREFIAENVSLFPVHILARDNVKRHLGSTYQLPPGTPAIILTDGYNPIDFYDTVGKESVRKTILDTTDWDVLI